ncbi:MAG: dipeptide epimerase [Ignavibacteria bacterium RIFOXYB2_FULL_35_12]|nr:MAG: dipeptide epimerase [Ignavibacteria bacterium GWA2_36_19]OGU59729.1 MAG: dipeptide epimerase [Ignavibacteria bacterium GWF2_35_20]OGU85197.1 MAG: dipeptide epimerase [Ignavibacteria bacterium RIFOXYA12_FULL_35_25]OGU91792.1 MAG: dipeptide epimerase [Ignavibacteria bacterium RIFOXYC12_FULL_35_11]OGU97450.1 MAG: dipeptide epimerase [Ignavibacteria bacterium RIFOXYB12_FULL_35_14]OGV01176.1 MAG: dipeptide epimerase [Ignavibacteria bacterium RIFOXYC2_FULL_35_16]OGV03799.1 MAG: dipeptide ep
MKQKRRDFLKTTGLLVGTAITASYPAKSLLQKSNGLKMNGKLKLSYKPYTLDLKHVFTIATSSRTTTPVVLTEVEYEGIIGYGEASLPPYLGESHQTVSEFLSKIDLSKYENVFNLENMLNDIDKIAPGNTAAKASVDIALHDLVGKLLNQPWYNIWGFDKEKTPYTSFTIGIDTPDVVRTKVKEAEEYKILKVKLGRETDKEMIETIRSVSDTPITVDVNQGWKDKNFALEMIHWLKERYVLFVEQPMPKTQIDDMAWLTERSPLPTIGDESVQRLEDVIKAHGVFSGINIKLMKCTGMREAHKMILMARALGMKVMLGCMTETSCAISAASHLSPMVDWADLDGALLIKNDVFDGTKVIDGKVTLTDRPGIGVVKT